MADEDRPPKELTKEQIEAAIEWLRERRSDHSCPSCGRNEFSVERPLAGVPLQVVDGPMVLGRSYPCLVLICRHCAYMMFYSAMMMGLHKAKTSKEKTEEHEEQEESHAKSS